MFSRISAFIALSLLQSVSSSPTRRNSPIAATYVITNDPNGNSVLSALVDGEGNLSWGNAVSTQGKGLHGNNTNPNAGDGLFAQDTIVVRDNYLFTVNPGSNTVVMFAIDETDPSQLTLVGNPVDSGGEFPQSVAVSPYGLACVVNGGAKAGVLCYDANPTEGLTPLPDTWRPLYLDQTTPAFGPGGSASDIVFSETGDELLVSVKGIAPAPGFIASWTVGSDWRSLSETTISKGGDLPFGLTQIRGTTGAWLNADPGVGVGIWDFTETPAVDTLFPIPGQKAICWSEYSTETGNYYTVDAGAVVITELSISTQTLTPSVVNQYNITGGLATIDFSIATIGASDYLFVLSSGTTSVIGFVLEGPGQAKQISAFNFNSTSNVAPTNIQGMAVYVAAS